MPGLKQTQLFDNPVAFWTFDTDQNGFNNAQIVDEIQNQNPLTVNGINYLLEQKSLNDLETTDQASVYLCPNGTRELPPNGVEGDDEFWLNTFFEAPQSTAFDFFNLGSFTIEFMYDKQRYSDFRLDEDYWGIGLNWTSYTPMIIKEDMINITMRQAHNIVDQLYVSFFGRVLNIEHSNLNNLFDRTNHVVVVNDVKQIDVNEYESTLTVYLNGRAAATDVQVYIDEYPITTTRGSWLVGGNGGNTAATDFATERFKIDQIAIYNYAFDWEQVSNHYKKSVHYDELVQRDYCHRYWRMNEVDPLDYTMYDTGNSNTKHHGVYGGNVLRNQSGPEKLVESVSQKFQDEGSAIAYYDVVTNVYGGVTIDVNQDYTLDFWFKVSGSKQGVIFSAAERENPWNGLTVWINTSNDQHTPGNIQVSESQKQYISSRDIDPTSEERLLWNDDIWHHLVVRRKDNTLELWIDGEIQAEGINYPPVSNGKYSNVYMMGIPPGGFEVSGNLSEVAFYNYAIQDMQINSRWKFTNRYKIEGYTLLQGVPVSATVRFYDHINGELLGEEVTDHVTGLYQFYPATQRFVDVLSFIPDNKTTRYRVHGPIKPAEYDDSHLL